MNFFLHYELIKQMKRKCLGLPDQFRGIEKSPMYSVRSGNHSGLKEDQITTYSVGHKLFKKER